MIIYLSWHLTYMQIAEQLSGVIFFFFFFTLLTVSFRFLLLWAIKFASIALPHPACIACDFLCHPPLCFSFLSVHKGSGHCYLFRISIALAAFHLYSSFHNISISIFSFSRQIHFIYSMCCVDMFFLF